MFFNIMIFEKLSEFNLTKQNILFSFQSKNIQRFINIMQERIEQLAPVIPEIKFKCLEGHESKLVCVSENCSKCAFICHASQCECMSTIHSHCNMNSLKTILAGIERQKKSKTPETDQAFQAIQKIYIQAIQKLSEEKIKFADSYELFGLSENSVKFVNSLKQNNLASIDGDLVSRVKAQIQNQELLHLTLCTLDDVEIFWQKNKTKLDKFCSILRLLRSKRELTNKLITKLINNQQAALVQSWMPKKVKGYRFLFRASQHDFRAHKFHECCDNIPNTLVIIQTQFNKIIGGYTPIPWQSLQSIKNFQDPSETSFIFSINMRQKFQLIDKSNAVSNQKVYGPMFGGSGSTDIKIGDECNSKKSSLATFASRYNDSTKSFKSEQKNHTLFSGALSSNTFLVKEYQVYEILFF